MIRKIMEDWMREECLRRGYQLVYTPHVARVNLWQTSGHEGFYAGNMFTPMELDDAMYRMKPMNCPFHILIYKNTPKSYRDLPVRYAELGNVYRYERSGTMHGLLRVRGFTQDDAHIFCMPSQIESEVAACIDFAEAVLKTFGFSEFKVELSTWDPNDRAHYAGSNENWDLAIRSLDNVLKAKGIPYKTIPGEAAFYGPKIDVKLVDVLGRLWQLSTVQFDFNLPARFELEYVGEDGERHQPVMVHRALFGSVERFFGVLIEHYAGAFPLWLAPVQIGLVPISERHAAYAAKVEAALKDAGFRVEDGRPQRKDERQDPRLRQPEDALHPRLRRQGRSRRLGQRPHARQRRPGLHAARGLHRQSHGAGRHAVDGVVTPPFSAETLLSFMCREFSFMDITIVRPYASFCFSSAECRRRGLRGMSRAVLCFAQAKPAGAQPATIWPPSSQQTPPQPASSGAPQPLRIPSSKAGRLCQRSPSLRKALLASARRGGRHRNEADHCAHPHPVRRRRQSNGGARLHLYGLESADRRRLRSGHQARWLCRNDAAPTTSRTCPPMSRAKRPCTPTFTRSTSP